MLTEQRKRFILEKLQKEGQVVAKQLAQDLDLSEDTIRRDLRDLAKEGLLQRVHGGALPASSAVVDFNKRRSIATEAKVQLGKTAATLIQPGQIVILDGGTTNAQLARHLPRDLLATIVTHSPSIAMELIDHPLIEVILIGGKLFKHSVVTMGTAALEALTHIQADLFFMGVTGVHHETGLTTGDYEEAHMKRALGEHAAETLVMASNEKLGVASPYLIMPLPQISGLILEEEAPQTQITRYQALGLSIHTVKR